jgi:ABC-2 type transport system ATP-binding protein
MSEPLVRVDGLYKQFGHFTAVNGISFEVAEGSCFGLIGSNGAGKTTTIKIMTTLLKADAGTVLIAGQNVRLKPSVVRGLIGYVPQSISADGALTGRENLSIMAKLYGLSSGERRSRIAAILPLLDLAEAADRLTRTYSGGMIRRLEIGQAILHRPKLLFLDEPTIGLDPIARKAIWTYIGSLQKEFGISIILTTHYMDEAEQMCSALAIMNHGSIVAHGTLTQLRQLSGQPEASMDDLFAHFAGSAPSTEGGMKDVARTRRTIGRLG